MAPTTPHHHLQPSLFSTLPIRHPDPSSQRGPHSSEPIALPSEPPACPAPAPAPVPTAVTQPVTLERASHRLGALVRPARTRIFRQPQYRRHLLDLPTLQSLGVYHHSLRPPHRDDLISEHHKRGRHLRRRALAPRMGGASHAQRPSLFC
jgi:hypothetical protein